MWPCRRRRPVDWRMLIDMAPIMNPSACGSSVPTTCDFAGDSCRSPVGNLRVGEPALDLKPTAHVALVRSAGTSHDGELGTERVEEDALVEVAAPRELDELLPPPHREARR